VALACWLAAFGLLLAACGGGGGAKDNGVASQTPQEIVTSVKAAVKNATSVHFVGGGSSNGQTLALNLKLEKGKGGTGTVSFSGVTIQIVKDGDKLYFKGGSAFLKQYAGQAASLLAGKWLYVPSTMNGFSSFTPLTNMTQLIDKILASHGTLAKGQTTTIDGQPAIAIVDKTNGGTLYVATTGPAYPLELKPKTGNKGLVRFTDWDQPVTITPPPHPVDLSKLTGG